MASYRPADTPPPTASNSYYASIADIASRARKLRDVTADIEATADSPDGLISATVNSRGDLVKLELDDRIYRTADSVALAATITATIQAAAAELDLAIAAKSASLFAD